MKRNTFFKSGYIVRVLAILGILLSVLVPWTAPVSAATAVYTDKIAWENALSERFFTEDFSDEQLNTGVSFVSTSSGHINPALDNYQDVLAHESATEPMTTWNFTPRIAAFGGNWTLGGPGGSGNSLHVYIADSSLYVGTVSNTYGGGFWGFISDSPFTSVSLIGGAGSHQQHYSLDNMVYSPILAFIPATILLLLLDD